MSQTTFTIKDSKYEVYYLIGREALTMAHRIARYLLPAMTHLEPGKTDLQAAAKTFFENCGEDEFFEFAKIMFKNCTIDNKPGEHAWQTHFQGKVGEMLQVLVKIVTIQFEDFFSELTASVNEPARSPHQAVAKILD